ncbi:MAG: F0F1 ATP synthase subunit delta [Patescibacteria group bacterium]
MELFGKLGIEWKLLLAQGLNFILLLIILRKFLYKPILKMLDERKAKAESLQVESSKMEERRKQFENWTDDQVNEARRKSEMILLEAEKFAGKLKTRKLDEMSVEKQRAMLDGQKQLSRDRIALERELRESIAGETAERMQKLFSEISNNLELHGVLLDKTIAEFSQYKFDKTQMAKVMLIEIQTAKDLSKADKDRLQKILIKCLGREIKISPSTNPKLIAGAKITLGGFEFDGSLTGRLKKANG